MSATIDQIQRTLLDGRPFVFGRQHLIALRKYLNNTRNKCRSGVLADMWQLIEDTGPHPVDEEVSREGTRMLDRLRTKKGAWAPTAYRRLGEKERKVLENLHYFSLVGFWSLSDSTDVGYQTRNHPGFEADKVLPVFRATASDESWFNYINIPWQMFYNHRRTGIEVVG